MNNDKLIRVANTLDILANVGGKICRAVGIVCLVFTILVLIFGEKMFAQGSLSLDLAFLKLYLADDFQVITGPIQVYAVVSLLVVGALCFFVYYASTLIRKILAPMKVGRPFEASVTQNLKKITWVVLAGGLLTNLIGIAERILLTKAYPMEEIFSSSAIQSIEYVFTMDFNFVIVACVILFLSYIFSYGQILQQESDETL